MVFFILLLKDCTYERMQEELRKIDSKNLENPSELAEYATVNFQGCFDTVQPSTTNCEYATVKFGRYPTSGSVIQPPRPTEKDLNSAFLKQQKKLK